MQKEVRHLGLLGVKRVTIHIVQDARDGFWTESIFLHYLGCGPFKNKHFEYFRFSQMQHEGLWGSQVGEKRTDLQFS